MNPHQVKQWLRQGIAAAKAGNDEQARELLLKVVDVDEYNEQAWVWLSGVVGSDEDREICLENVLAINPDNHLAQAGLAYLRGRQATATPPPKPKAEQQAEPMSPSQPKPTPQTPKSQPAPQPPAAAASEPPDAESLDARLAAATTPPSKPKMSPGPPTTSKLQTTPEPQGEPEAQTAPAKEAKTEVTKAPSLTRRLVGQLWLIAPLFAAALVVGAMAFLIIQFKPFDPTARNYANAMQPLLETYAAWWSDGPYGALISELTSLCGPGANGWRNRDVLLNCSHYPSTDCTHLAGHCGGNIEAMRRRVSRLAQEAKQTGTELLSDLETIEPPPEIAQHHVHFIGCLETQLDNADWAKYAASGEAAPLPNTLPICQMFPTAEQALLGYVNGQ